MADWPEVVDTLRPYVVKLSTPRGSGTGFVLSFAPGSDLAVVATAAHVIDGAHYWEEPIRVLHAESGKTTLLHANERAIFLEESLDTAAILFNKGDLPFPDLLLDMTPEQKFLRPGSKIGWLGFPAVAPSALCFFDGCVSAWVQDSQSYLVDGVAINGVSGGPAFHVSSASGKPVLVGVVSAYIPNRATGETLPGLCVIRDVQQFQELAKKFETVEEAKENETVQSEPPPPPERVAGDG